MKTTSSRICALVLVTIVSLFYLNAPATAQEVPSTEDVLTIRINNVKYRVRLDGTVLDTRGATVRDAEIVKKAQYTSMVVRERISDSKYNKVVFAPVTRTIIELQSLVKPLSGAYAYVLFSSGGFASSLVEGGVAGGLAGAFGNVAKDLTKDAILEVTKELVEHPEKTALKMADDAYALGLHAYRDNYAVYKKVIKEGHELSYDEAVSFMANERQKELLGVATKLIRNIRSKKYDVGEYADNEKYSRQAKEKLLTKIADTKGESLGKKVDIAIFMTKFKPILEDALAGLDDYKPYADFQASVSSLDESFTKMDQAYHQNMRLSEFNTAETAKARWDEENIQSPRFQGTAEQPNLKGIDLRIGKDQIIVDERIRQDLQRSDVSSLISAFPERKKEIFWTLMRILYRKGDISHLQFSLESLDPQEWDTTNRLLDRLSHDDLESFANNFASLDWNTKDYLYYYEDAQPNLTPYYFGCGIENTIIGDIVLRADLALKYLVMGVDGKGKRIHLDSEYKHLLRQAYENSSTDVWRAWIFLKEARITESYGNLSIDVEIGIGGRRLTDLDISGAGRYADSGMPDKYTNLLVKYIERNYDKLSEIFASFQELREVYQVLVYAEFLRSSGLLPKYDESIQVAEVLTPTSVKGIATAYFFKTGQHNAVNYRKKSILGGVALETTHAMAAIEPNEEFASLGSISSLELSIETEDNPFRLYSAGRKFAKQEKPSVAIKYFNKALAVSPDFIAALLDRGTAYWEMNEDSFAENDLTRFIELDPSSFWAYTIRAQVRVRLDNIAGALQDFENALKLRSNEVGILLIRGILFMDRGEIDKAINDFEIAIKRAPTLSWTYTYLGTAYAEQESYSKAVEVARRAIEIAPTDVSAYQGLARIYLKKGQPQNALDLLNKSISIKDDDAESYRLLGATYKDLDDKELTKESYMKALQLDPKDPGVLYNLGEFYYDNGDMTSAESYYKQSLETDKNAASYFGLGRIFRQKQRFQIAQRYFKKAIKLNPRFVEAYYNLGVTYISMRKYEKGLHNFSKAIEIKPNLGDAYNGIATIYFLTGRYKEAWAIINKAEAKGLGNSISKELIHDLKQVSSKP